MMSWIDDLIGALELKPYTTTVLVVAVGLIGLGRTLLEIVLANRRYFGEDVLNNCVFYFVVAWGFTLVLAGLTKVDWRRVSMVVLAGLSVGLLPPLIDVFIYGVGNFAYTYYFGWPDLFGLSMFDRSSGMPLGEGLGLWGAVGFAAYYVFLKTASLGRAVLGALGVYLLVFMLVGVALPSWGQRLAEFSGQPAMVMISLLQLVVGLGFYLSLRPRLALTLLKRSLHCLPFVLICLIGAAMTARVTPLALLSAALILLVGLVALVQNDYYDRAEDSIAGRELVVDKLDVEYFNLMFAALFLTVYWGKSLIYLPLGAIYLLALVYHHDAFRLKGIFPFNQMLEGLWGALAFVAGILACPPVVFTAETASYCLLVFLGWTLLSAFKDAKDLEADAAVGHRNLYTYLRGRGLSLVQAHRFQGVVSLGFCVVPIAWLWFKHLPLAWAVFFPLASLPVLVAAYTRPPGRQSVIMTLGALSYTLLLFLSILLLAYTPVLAPR